MPTPAPSEKTAAAQERLRKALEERDRAIEAASRQFWQTVKAEIDSREITQAEAGRTLDYSREQIRKQTQRFSN